MHNATAGPVVQTLMELPDIINNLLLLLSEKEKQVIVKRFDIGDVGKHTLEQVGKEFSVTRERVRQIEKSALNKMKRNVFNTSLRHLHDFSHEVVGKSGGFLREDALSNSISTLLPNNFNLDVSGLHLSLVLNDKLTCVGNTINFFPYVRENALSDFSLKYVSNHLINQLHKYGNVKSLDKLQLDLRDVLTEVDFDITKVKSLIDIDKRITILDDQMVGLLEWRHVNPRTLRDKILYVLRKSKKPIHFASIAESIQGAKFDKRSVNLQAVHNELIRHDQFVLIGRGIYALKEWGYESGTVSRVIERILRESGELSQEDIVDKVLAQRQVKRITIILALKNCNSFERVGRRMYRLKK